MKHTIITYVFGVFFSTLLFAQNNSIVDSLSFYGKLSVHCAVYDKEAVLQQNSPRTGLYLERNLLEELKAVGNLEYGINIIDNNVFNNDANTMVDFVNDPYADNESFVTRLGFIGLQHDKWGALTLGKQWGVYYDVAGFTDLFTVFGGEATGVYSGNSDGGWKGTGRADNAIVYRNSISNLNFGLQAQLLNGSQNYGASLIYNFDFGLSLGVAGNVAKMNNGFEEFILYNRDNNANLVFSGRFIKENKLNIAFSYAINQDEFTTVTTPTDEIEIIAYPTHGLELFISYYLNQKFELQAGFNKINDVESDSYFNGDYSLMHYILGANYYITPNTYVYTSARIGNSKFVNNVRDYDVFVLGFCYSFNFNKSY